MASVITVMHSLVHDVFAGLYVSSLMFLFLFYIGAYYVIFYIVSPLIIMFYGLFRSLKILLEDKGLVIPPIKVRRSYYIHISIYILSYVLLNNIIFHKYFIPYIKGELRFIGSSDIVISYYFIFIELLSFWTLNYHFKYIADKYKTSYVLYWPFHIICVAVFLSFYILFFKGTVGIISNDTILFVIVTYKVLYSFGWQLIMIYLIHNYLQHNESRHLRILHSAINIIFIIILLLVLIINGDIAFNNTKLPQINDHAIFKIYETLILFYLLTVYRSIHANDAKKYISYITIIIGNIIVISYYMPFIDEMKEDYYIIMPSLLLNTVIISIMLFRILAYLFKQVSILTHRT